MRNIIDKFRITRHGLTRARDPLGGRRRDRRVGEAPRPPLRGGRRRRVSARRAPPRGGPKGPGRRRREKQDRRNTARGPRGGPKGGPGPQGGLWRGLRPPGGGRRAPATPTPRGGTPRGRGARRARRPNYKNTGQRYIRKLKTVYTASIKKAAGKRLLRN